MKNFGPRVGHYLFAEYVRAENGDSVPAAAIFYGPGQTEDQIQPEANDRISSDLLTELRHRFIRSTRSRSSAAYNVNDPNLGVSAACLRGQLHDPGACRNYTLSVEQELPAEFQLMVAYVGSAGRNLFLRAITNTITGVYQNAATGAGTAIRQFTVGGVPTTPANDGAPGTNRFAEIDYKTSGGYDNYNSLQTTLQRRFNSGRFVWCAIHVCERARHLERIE